MAHNFETLLSMKQINCVLNLEYGITESECQNIVYMHR